MNELKQTDPARSVGGLASLMNGDTETGRGIDRRSATTGSSRRRGAWL
ncbi:MAG: hypothetical protein KJ070_09225 [Verrucomicrobia bacterium]|nr:hypothetical protein [Verrucomicrobiota bacterium]